MWTFINKFNRVLSLYSQEKIDILIFLKHSQPSELAPKGVDLWFVAHLLLPVVLRVLCRPVLRLVLRKHSISLFPNFRGEPKPRMVYARSQDWMILFKQQTTFKQWPCWGPFWKTKLSKTISGQRGYYCVQKTAVPSRKRSRTHGHTR